MYLIMIENRYAVDSSATFASGSNAIKLEGAGASA